MKENLEYIDAYFQRMLDQKEIKRFEQRLTEDKEFAEEVAFYLSARQSLKQEADQEKKERFRQLLAQQAPVINIDQNRTGQRVWLYRIAAAAAVLMFGFLAWSIFFSKSSSPEQLADNYINENFKTLSIKMGPTDSLQEGLRLYNSEKYDSALKQFEPIAQRNPGDDQVKTYLGITYLKVGNYDKALQSFQAFEHDTLYYNPSVFYQALTLLKRNLPGDKQKAKELLQRVVNDNLDEKESAEQWLKKW
jgi:tetratricopeptide (TPR) repeat protein